jgi:hypothetical protein
MFIMHEKHDMTVRITDTANDASKVKFGGYDSFFFESAGLLRDDR